ncbi:MAG: ribonuclease HII [Bacteroidetes bacterium]|nr:ribonuclease HII [Bacteroidota bacterium]
MALSEKFSSYSLEAGCDEAGRGCLAGPVYAAAVILKPGSTHPLLNDSKQVSKANRNDLREWIEAESLHWAIGVCSPAEIDKINILNASIEAMHRALAALQAEPEFILVDGNRFKPFRNIPYATMVQGDARFRNIAAASILAKTHRDSFMEKLHVQFPQYGWISNAGYPTPPHRAAIARYGITPHHRKTFRLLPDQLDLFGH